MSGKDNGRTGEAAQTDARRVEIPSLEQFRQLEEEVASLRLLLRTTVEENDALTLRLKINEEELATANEELTTVNEELMSANEELRNTNEELATSNNDLQVRVEEVSRINTDLSNFIAATDIGTLFLDRALCIKRYTPAAAALYNLIPEDVGRPLRHLTGRLDYATLVADADTVLTRLGTIEREVATKDGRRYFLVRLRPYATLDGKIEGVVVCFVDITERKRSEAELHETESLLRAAVDRASAEKAVRESEAKFRAFVSAVSDVIYETSADWREMYFLTGREFITTTEQTHGDWVEEYIPEDEKPRVRAAIQRAIETRSKFELEHRVLRLDGTIGWTFSRAIPLKNERGEILRWFGAARDITDRKQAEETLRASEERMRLAIRATRMVTWEWLPTQDIITTSDSLADVYGLPALAGAAEGFALVLPQDTEAHVARVRRIAAEGGAYTSEFRIKRPNDGRIVWLEERAEAHTDTDGRVVRVIGVTFDITERKEAEHALSERVAEIETLLETIPAVVWIATDPECRHIIGNRASYELLRMPPQTNVSKSAPPEEIPTTFRTLIGGREIEPHEQPMQRAAAERREIRGSEVTIVFNDGSQVEIFGNTSPLFDTEGNVRGVVAVFVDITDRKKAEENLRESRAALARELEDTKLLQKVSSLLIEDEDSAELYEPILDAAMAIMGADFGSVQLLDAKRGVLHLLAWRNFHPDSAAFWQTVSAESSTSCGSALRNGERIVLPDVRADDSLQHTDDLHYYLLSGILSMQSTPLMTRDGRLVGMISTHWRAVHTPGERELRLLDILARQAADYFERRRTEAELREALGTISQVNIELTHLSETRLALVRRIVGIQEAERQTVAYELHDGLTQYVMTSYAHLEAYQTFLQRGEGAGAAAVEQLNRGVAFLRHAVVESRRLVNGLHTLTLDDLGLAGALEKLLHEAREQAGWQAAPLVSNVGRRRYDPALETTVFRVAQEALTNAVKHARAGEVSVTLIATVRDDTDEPIVLLEVRDNGIGFRPEEARATHDQMGLHSMSERVSLLGGTLDLISTPGEGTAVRATFPVPPQNTDGLSARHP